MNNLKDDLIEKIEEIKKNSEKNIRLNQELIDLLNQTEVKTEYDKNQSPFFKVKVNSIIEWIHTDFNNFGRIKRGRLYELYISRKFSSYPLGKHGFYDLLRKNGIRAVKSAGEDFYNDISEIIA